MTLTKEKLNDNTQVNFNHSKEIIYWSKRFNISPAILQQAFIENGNSISKTLSYCHINYATQR